MRYRPRQVCLCDPNRLLSSLPRFSAHCHARSLLPTVVKHSTIYDENPDLHHGLLALYYDASSLVLARGLSPVCSKSALGATNGFLDRTLHCIITCCVRRAPRDDHGLAISPQSPIELPRA